MRRSRSTTKLKDGSLGLESRISTFLHTMTKTWPGTNSHLFGRAPSYRPGLVEPSFSTCNTSYTNLAVANPLEGELFFFTPIPTGSESASFYSHDNSDQGSQACSFPFLLSLSDILRGADTAQADPGSIVGITSRPSIGRGWTARRQVVACQVCGVRTREMEVMISCYDFQSPTSPAIAWPMTAHELIGLTDLLDDGQSRKV